MKMRHILDLLEGQTTAAENAPLSFSQWAPIAERYSNDNNYLRRYLAQNDFDPYPAWHKVAEWIEENGHLDEITGPDGEPFESASDLEEGDPDLFYQLPDDVQEECGREVTEWMMFHMPSETQSTAHFDLQNSKPLPRQTWLIHLSNNAHNISLNGFQYGSEQMDQLGLTRHYHDDRRMSVPGYNFAFLANSRDALRAVNDKKYGKHAVIFQNSGVHAYHYGDEEHQVIFWGPDVDKRGIVELRNDYGDWCVVAKRDLPNGSDVLFKSERFEDACKWVIKNHQQYRRYL